jgi:hypothetical protein
VRWKAGAAETAAGDYGRRPWGGDDGNDDADDDDCWCSAQAGAALGASVFLKVKSMYCPVDPKLGVRKCGKKTPRALVDKGLRLVFISCAVLAVVGFIWTWLFVDDSPHKSLEQAESAYDVEPEQPGELQALERAAGHPEGGDKVDGTHVALELVATRQ